VANASMRVVGVDLGQFDWFHQLDKGVVLDAGDLAPATIEVPVSDAREIVHSVVRRVLDLPRRSTPTVVWTLGRNELLVHSDRTNIRCSSGVVTITATVECDQHKRVGIPVPLGVGTRKAPAGLVMTTFTDLEGPAAIVDTWHDAIVAFAWETLLETASVIAGAVGNDKRGRPLVPGSIAAAPGKLLVQPIARHKLSAEA